MFRNYFSTKISTKISQMVYMHDVSICAVSFLCYQNTPSYLIYDDFVVYTHFPSSVAYMRHENSSYLPRVPLFHF